MTIYELNGEYMELMDMLEVEPDSEIIKDTLEALSGELDQKYEGYCKIIKEFEGRAKAIKGEIERLKEKMSSAEHAAKRLRNALFDSMQLTERKKIDGAVFTIYLKNNAPQLDKIPDILPGEYLIQQEPTIDKRKLLADVKAGVNVPGVTLRQGQCLMIK